MHKSQESAIKTIITVISLAVGFGIKQLMKEGWKKTYDEEPPGEKMDEEIDWGKLILWTIVSGLIYRIMKVGIKRSMAVTMKNRDMLD